MKLAGYAALAAGVGLTAVMAAPILLGVGGAAAAGGTVVGIGMSGSAISFTGGLGGAAAAAAGGTAGAVGLCTVGSVGAAVIIPCSAVAPPY